MGNFGIGSSMPDSILTHSGITSEVWQRLKTYIEGRIETKRRANDGDLSEIKTAKLRGEIKALKDILQAVEPKQYKTRDEK